MVTIIKNQLLKHLSRYTKNLSPEQISLSALRGSGELQDLTLDEDLLTDLLELPLWVRLTSAKCNRASFRIQWTKLKTVPIVLNLDEVHIALEVCPDPRVANANAGGSMPIPGKYSYIHKVIDGISVAVNQVQIEFKCEAFLSTVQISRVTVESRTPDGRKGDLRLTRLKNPDTGQLLIFKELEWQSARIEAKALGDTSPDLAPLRLLMGNTHCRIVIKKRLSDCQILGSRLAIRPEPIAWALTDGQVRAALACVNALAAPVKKAAAAATRAKAAKKIQEPQYNEPSSRVSTSSGGDRDVLARLFAQHDVRETSYHLLAPRIDFHLCDDPGLGRSSNPSLSGGGALQVTLVGMQADFFPYHRSSDDRRHWRGYREAATPHAQWLSQSLVIFCAMILDLLDPKLPATPSNKSAPTDTSNEEEPLLSNGVHHKTQANNTTSASTAPSNHTTSLSSPKRTRILQNLSRLMTTCLVLRIDDFTIYKVSTGSKSREPIKPLVSAEKTTMPGDAGLLHAELTFFYYPGDMCFPIPPPKLYIQLAPVRVSFSPQSIIWLSAMLPHLAAAMTDAQETETYCDVRAEAIMPKIVLEAGSEHVPQQRDRPKELHICAARVTLTNVREQENINSAGTRSELASLISQFRRSAPGAGQFPQSAGSISPLHPQLLLHADKLDDIPRDPSSPTCTWSEPRSVWWCRAEPAWAEFVGARATTRPAACVDAAPLTVWFHIDQMNIYALCRTSGLTCVQLNQFQLLMLLRQVAKISDMAAWMHADAARVPSEGGNIVLGVVVPAVELNLVLPSNVPGLESSRDLDSVPLDSSSLQDMKMGSEATVAPSILDRDSGVLATQSIEIFSCQPLPAEEIPSPSPAMSFSGFTSMRRGLSSLVTSIDSAWGRDDVSTGSSDSERYVVVGLAGSPDDADVAFREFEHGKISSGAEVAAEVVERSSSASDHSVTSSCRRRDVISTCTFRITNIHAVQQTTPNESTLRMVAADVSCTECPAIPWDEFQSKFAMRSRAWVEPTAESEDEFKPREAPKIAARMTRNEQPVPLNDKGEPTGVAPFDELLEAVLQDIQLSLNMSTALALAEFFEDEVVQPPMPLEVLINNIKLHLIEDRVSRSISSPPPQPLNLDLTSIRLTRDNSGVVTLGPPAATPSTLASPATPQNQFEPDLLRSEIERLNFENEELKKRLSTLAKISDDNRELRAKVEEASVLRQCAHAAQREAATLLADKRELLDTIHQLQEQLGGRGKR